MDKINDCASKLTSKIKINKWAESDKTSIKIFYLKYCENYILVGRNYEFYLRRASQRGLQW